MSCPCRKPNSRIDAKEFRAPKREKPKRQQATKKFKVLTRLALLGGLVVIAVVLLWIFALIILEAIYQGFK
jgi:cell division septal protein FtsQ